MKKPFIPTGSTGRKNSDFLYRSYLVNSEGAAYELLLEPHHTKEDKERAKKYIKDNFDAVTIKFVKP